jgi:hypothetical protein
LAQIIASVRKNLTDKFSLKAIASAAGLAQLLYIVYLKES